MRVAQDYPLGTDTVLPLMVLQVVNIGVKLWQGSTETWGTVMFTVVNLNVS